VTTSGWLGCLKCRWLPLDRISIHPCFSSKRITSRTFIGIGSIVRYRRAGPGGPAQARAPAPLSARFRSVCSSRTWWSGRFPGWRRIP
jgi:hypothetical protein